MTAVAAVIVELYENSGMTPQQIAEDQGLEILAVKATLAAHSDVFRRHVTEEVSKVVRAEVVEGGKEEVLKDVESGEIVEQEVVAPVSESKDLVHSFTNDEMAEIKNTMQMIMRDGDNDAVRLKAAVYLNEEATGRNEKRITSAAEAGKLNVLLLSDVMKRAHAAVNRSRAMKVIKPAVELTV